jgi:hypothetical protein
MSYTQPPEEVGDQAADILVVMTPIPARAAALSALCRSTTRRTVL